MSSNDYLLERNLTIEEILAHLLDVQLLLHKDLVLQGDDNTQWLYNKTNLNKKLVDTVVAFN